MSHRVEPLNPDAYYVALMVMAARLLSKVLAGYCLVQGLNIIFAGPVRFGAAGYQYALAAPGAPWSWGGAILVAGLIMVYGILSYRPCITAVGIYLAAVWSAFFAITFAWAAYVDPTANTTGMWVYGKDAVLCVVLAHVRWSQPELGLTDSGRRWLERTREDSQ